MDATLRRVDPIPADDEDEDDEDEDEEDEEAGEHEEDEEDQQTAFVLLLLMPEENGRKPGLNDYHPPSDPYYACAEAWHCDCPLAKTRRMWKVDWVSPGGPFDGRVSGQTPLKAEAWMNVDAREWDRNLVRPLDLQGPQSAYAVITPDGLWHECVEPEPQDLVIGPTKDVLWTGLVQPERKLCELQVSWRFEVAEFLMRYQHCWLVGCEARLASSPARDCRDYAYIMGGSKGAAQQGHMDGRFHNHE